MPLITKTLLSTSEEEVSNDLATTTLVWIALYDNGDRFGGRVFGWGSATESNNGGKCQRKDKTSELLHDSLLVM